MCRTERTRRATLSNRSPPLRLQNYPSFWHRYDIALTFFEQVTFTNEQEREGGENTENKEGMKKNWKENYVPYDDNKEEGGDNKDKKEVEKVAEEDADEEEERHGDEKDSYEKEVDGKEKL